MKTRILSPDPRPHTLPKEIIGVLFTTAKKTEANLIFNNKRSVESTACALAEFHDWSSTSQLKETD